MQNENNAQGTMGQSHVLFEQIGLPSIDEIQREQQHREETFFERQLPSFVDATHSAKEALDTLNNLSPELKETIDAYRKSAGAITEAASHFSNMIENIKKTLEIIPVAKPFLNKILDALTIAYDIIMACLNKVFYTIPTLIVRLFQLFGVDAMLINQFVKNVITISTSKEIVEGPEPARAQGLAMLDIFTEGIGTLITGGVPDMARMKYVNETLRYKTGITKEFKDLGELALTFLRTVPDQVQIWMSYVVPTKWWLDIFAPGTKFYDWIDEVNTLDSHAYTVKAAYDHVIQQKILTLYNTGQELLKECTTRGTKVAQVYKLLESSFKKIDGLYKIVDMSALNRGGRRVPFVIYIYGQSGQGKSFLMTVLPAILAGCPPDTPNLAWARNPGCQHWDGYTGQFAVKYDDFGALVNAGQNGPGDIGEMMMIVSNEQMRIPMAALEDKGEVFRSQVVVCSSNVAYIAANEMRDPQALYRRRHAFYEVRVKQQYRKQGSLEVDPALIPDDYSHWEFIERHNFDQNWRGNTINYQQFIREIKEKYRKHIAQQQQASVNYETMIAAANLEPARAEGLAEDFHQFMNLSNTFETRGQRNLFTQEEGAKFYQALQEIDRRAAKPSWYDALMAVLPLASIVAGTIGIVYGMRKIYQKSSERKAKNLEEKTSAQRKEIAMTVRDLLKHPRVVKLTAEGRWDGLYNRLRNSTPEMVEIFSDAMDSCEDFSNLTDTEVEEIVDRTLRSPKIKKFLAAEGVYSGHHMRTQQRMNQIKPVIMPPAPLQAEGCIDQNAMEVTNNKLVPHLGRINVEDYELVCTMIGGRVVLTVYHLFCNREGERHKEGTPITVKVGTSIFRSAFDPSKLVKIGQDVVLYEMDACLPVYTNIAKHFMTEQGLENATEFPALMATVDRTMIPIVYRIESKVKRNDLAFFYSADMQKESKYWDDPKSRPDIISKFNPDSDFPIAQATAWSYRTDTFPGMCGSCVVMLDKFAARKIVGIHAAGGNTGDGIAQIVTEEMINRGLRVLGFNLQPAYPRVDLNNTDLGFVQAQGNFTKIGTIFKFPKAAEKTKIIPSITHGLIYPVKTAAAVLHSMDPRAFRIGDTTPLRKGIEKYGKPAPLVDNSILKRVIDCVSEIMQPLEAGMPRRILSQFEALNGVKGDEFVARMDMTTSSGYPWNQKPGAKGKSPFIQKTPNTQDYEIVDPELQRKVDHRLQQAKLGIRVPSVWIDTQKDERRSLEKIFEGKTRVFTIPPVDFTIVCRRLFGAFNSAFYNNKLKYFSAVGIDTASIDWTILLQKLETNSNIGFGGDFSGWDGNLSPQFMMGVCEIINRWYDDAEENQIARRVLFDEMVHTAQLAGNEIYFTHIGNPSGNPLTVIINTIIHKMKFLYAYFKRAPPELSSLQEFAKAIVLFIYGDDGICSIKKSMLPFFNPEILYEELKKLNLEYTNSTKTGPAHIEPVRELTFLKRGFREDECGRQHAIIDEQTITELTNWTRECADMDLEKASVDNLNDSLAFAYAYGKEYFDNHRRKIKENLKPELHQFLRDYPYYHQLFLSKHEAGRYVPAQAQGSVDPGMITDSTTPITTNTNEAPKTSDNTKGIILEAQREVEVSGPTMEPNSGGGRLTKTCMPDPSWSLPDTVHRRVWVNTYPWTTANAQGYALVTLSLPQDIIVNYLQSMAFERFIFWKGSINLDFELSGMKMHMGRLKAYAVPWTNGLLVANLQAASPTAYYGLNPISLDPASSTKGRLVVPFYNPKSYISINGPSADANFDFTATVIVSVLVPLGAATGSPTSINLAVWASFGMDSEFHVPLNSSAVGTVYNREHAKQLMRNAKFAPARAEGGTISTTNNITSYGDMDGTCIPQKMTNDDFQGAASGNKVDVPAFDRAARSMNPFNIVRKYIQNFSHSKGSEMVTRLDLDPSNLAVVTRDHFSTNVDEMSMSFLLCTPTWVDNVAWPGAATFGTSLYSGFIGPMTSLFTPGTTTQIVLTQGNQVYLTQWEYNAMRFAFWRGGMRIRIELVATMFHVGRLCLTLNYGAPPGVQVGLRDATSQYAVEFELNSDKNVFEYDIPYVASTRWKRTCRGPSSPDDPDVNGGAWWNDYFIGSFDISVVTQLQTTNVAPPDAVIILSYSGAKDFEVYMPSNINQTFISTITTIVPIPLAAKAQGDNGGGAKAGTSTAPNPPDASALLVGALRVGPPDMSGPMKDDHFGHMAPVKDLRSLLRRYYPFKRNNIYTYTAQSYTATTSNDQGAGYTPLFNTSAIPANQPLPYLIFEVIPVQPSDISYGTYGTSERVLGNHVTPLNFYGPEYRFWRGSMRYKFIFGNVENPTTNDLTPANSGVFYIPHGQFTDTEVPKAARPNWAWLAANYVTAIIGGTSSAGGDSQLLTGLITGINYAQDWVGHGIVNYSEIEIPFASIYNVLPTIQGSIPSNLSPDIVTTGVMIAWTILQYPYSASPGTAPFVRPLTVLKSVGDDFRFGTFMGIPKTYVQTVSYPQGVYWPDTWVTTPPANSTLQKIKSAIESNQKGRKKEDSESDWEIAEQDPANMSKSMLVKKLNKLSMTPQNPRPARAEGNWFSEEKDMNYWRSPQRHNKRQMQMNSEGITGIEHYEYVPFTTIEIIEQIMDYYESYVNEPIIYMMRMLNSKRLLEVKIVKSGTFYQVMWIVPNSILSGDFKIAVLDWVTIDNELYRRIHCSMIFAMARFNEQWPRKESSIRRATSFCEVSKTKSTEDTMVGIEDQALMTYCMDRHDTYLNEISEPIYKPAHAQGDVVPSFRPPTTANIALVVLSVFNRLRTEEQYNARMAMNEIVQNFHLCAYTTEMEGFERGFKIIGKFMIDNVQFSNTTGVGLGPRKKIAEEKAAYAVLSQLVDKVPACQRENMEVSDSDEEASTEQEILTILADSSNSFTRHKDKRQQIVKVLRGLGYEVSFMVAEKKKTEFEKIVLSSLSE